jgi:HlyD family secretion protein
MSNTELFPKEIIENTQESNFALHTVRSKIIFSTLLLFIIGVLCVLPMIKVDVGVRSQGIIRPTTEVVSITSPVSGNIKVLNVSENSLIREGDVFATVDAPQVNERLRFNRLRQNQVEMFVKDLNLLQKADSLTLISAVDLQSARYQQNWMEFRQKLLSQIQEINQVKRKFDREQFLVKRDALSQITLDDTRYSLHSAVNQYKIIVEQQKNQWEMDEINLSNELNQLRSENNQLLEELSQYEVRSPITGTVQNKAALFRNSFVYANQVLGEISPDTSLIAEVFINPRDIGFLREGMVAKFHVDAYNYNQWGIASGKIINISSDVIMNEGQPLFRVQCSLDQTYLELKNGFRGDFKKGMTLQARFIITRRSLFQLLYDKAEDWLNPSWGENEYATNEGG